MRVPPALEEVGTSEGPPQEEPHVSYIMLEGVDSAGNVSDSISRRCYRGLGVV